jgi:hypothetical protein
MRPASGVRDGRTRRAWASIEDDCCAGDLPAGKYNAGRVPIGAAQQLRSSPQGSEFGSRHAKIPNWNLLNLVRLHVHTHQRRTQL